MASVKICKKCGYASADGDFCPNDGTKLQKIGVDEIVWRNLNDEQKKRLSETYCPALKQDAQDSAKKNAHKGNNAGILQKIRSKKDDSSQPTQAGAQSSPHDPIQKAESVALWGRVIGVVLTGAFMLGADLWSVVFGKRVPDTVDTGNALISLLIFCAIWSISDVIAVIMLNIPAQSSAAHVPDKAHVNIAQNKASAPSANVSTAAVTAPVKDGAPATSAPAAPEKDPSAEQKSAHTESAPSSNAQSGSAQDAPKQDARADKPDANASSASAEKPDSAKQTDSKEPAPKPKSRKRGTHKSDAPTGESTNTSSTKKPDASAKTQRNDVNKSSASNAKQDAQPNAQKHSSNVSASKPARNANRATGSKPVPDAQGAKHNQANAVPLRRAPSTKPAPKQERKIGEKETVVQEKLPL